MKITLRRNDQRIIRKSRKPQKPAGKLPRTALFAPVLLAFLFISLNIRGQSEIRVPDADVATGAWTTAPLWSKINAPGGDVITNASNANNTGEVAIQDPTNEGTYYEIRVMIRARKETNGGRVKGISADIRINGSLISEQNLVTDLTATFTDYSYTWTGLNYSREEMNTLQVVFIGTDGGGGAPKNSYIDYLEVTLNYSGCQNASLTLTSDPGTDNQQVCLNAPLDAITYAVGGNATGATVSGLPDGVTGAYLNGIVTISGSPLETGIFNYTVTTTGTPAPCLEASANGTITVNALPTAVISGDARICSGDETTLTVDLTGEPDWSFFWSDGTSTFEVTGVASSPYTFNVSPDVTTTYTIVSVTDGNGCTAAGAGSAKVDIGPVALAAHVFGCAGEIVEVPITVQSFENIGAISLTLNYDPGVITFDSWDNTAGYIEYFNADETGANGIIRFSGATLTAFPALPDDAVLITLKFNHLGGSCDLEWNDSGDGTQCEFATGAPDFEPYCDAPAGIYYINGSVTESDPALVVDFIADNLFPPKFTDVTLTDLSYGGTPTAWQWSFDRTSVVFTGGTSATDQNPVVQFTDGGLYTVTLTIIGELCERTETKIDYIRAGRHGYWDGPTSADWYTATNWDDHLVPTILTDVVIPTRPVENVLPDPPYYYPNLPGNLIIGMHCNSVTLTGFGELTVRGVLQVINSKLFDLRDNSVVTAGTLAP